MTPKVLCIHRTTKDQLDWTVNHFHREAIKLGFASCRFHYLILKDGTIEQMRSLAEPGHHCLKEKKQANRDSIGLCIVGDKDPTLEQHRALQRLLQALNETNLTLKVVYAQSHS